ncbi:DNA-directed RNA polymerase subunit A' [Candidatus Woesearchaeota archaeon]|nr:DNA-directed RNA polymerase subunit A' [Candidatus Woesearchaeota archaeon]
MESLYVNKEVNSIVFGIFSPILIKKMASSKIVTPELYDKEGYPVDGGLMDIRMGVIDPGLKCKTCGSKLKECIGHFGYMELARPIIHIKFSTLVYDLLRATCADCGRILLSQDKYEKTLAKLKKLYADGELETYRKLAKSITTGLKTVSKCSFCGAKQPKITLDKPTTFLENDKRISPIEVRSRLEKIQDEDCEILGIHPKFMRPEWAVLTVLSIPPVTMRPSITLESGERSEDDLTHKLSDIVRINQRLFENINAGAPEIIIEDLWDLLQYHITTFFDNGVAQLPPARHRSGQPLKTLTARVKSKEGRIRHNLAGKRTNFSARSVISPDPMLKLDEVGIPKEIAMKITVPERVTDWNKEYLKTFVERGPKVYPGANYLVRPDGKKKRITEETKQALLEELENGYQVERHILDGDIALFNRQPSLHRMSVMAHKTRILPNQTFRINPAVCAPYGADFDGDEMNLHVPQTEEARAEAEILMLVQTQLISPRHGLSIVKCIQDAVSGNYLITRSETIPFNKAIDLLYITGINDFSKLPKKKTVTGAELASVLLPDDFNFTFKTKEGTDLIIKKGAIEKGFLDANSIGGDGAGMMLRELHKRYGQEVTVDILGKLLKLGIFAQKQIGITTGISDVDLPKEAIQKIKNYISKGYEEAGEKIDAYKKGELHAYPGRTIQETVELQILETLNVARNEAGKVVENYANQKTGIGIMANSGARGKAIHLAQMAACVGQQAIRGKRIMTGYSERTLPLFKKGDLNPDAHGFIKHGFNEGASPAEFFFIAMAGREGLMDTALRTPKSGYLYRRLSNALQDLKVEYDNTVRDSSGKIVQFEYGEDGIDVSKSENGIINVKKAIDYV